MKTPPLLTKAKRFEISDPVQVILDAIEGYMVLGLRKHAHREYLKIGLDGHHAQFGDFRLQRDGWSETLAGLLGWRDGVLHAYKVGYLTKADAIRELGLTPPK